MTPPPPAEGARRLLSRPLGAPSRPAPPRPPLRPVPPGLGRDLRRLATFFSAAVLIASLLMVVMGHAMLTQGQVQLARSANALSAEQAHHRSLVLQVAYLETPQRLVGSQQGHAAQPSQMPQQLAHVPLNVPLPAPTLTPAPPPGG